MEFKISLNNLLFYAYHGVLDEERQSGNQFKVNLSVSIPYDEKMGNDCIDNTVSYADLYQIIDDEMKCPRDLLETVAIKISKRIKEEFPMILSGKIKIEKIQPPIPGMLGSASVSLYF